jgi:putative SOS response-associated peptidase YedK
MAPNSELVAPVHDRMPVILQRQLERPWLDPGPRGPRGALLPAALPDPNEALPASPLLNSVRNDFPPVHKPKLAGAWAG